MTDAGEFPRFQPVEVCFNDSAVAGRRITWRVDTKDGHLLQYPTCNNNKRLLPDTVDNIHFAKFRYRLKSAEPWHAMTVHQGMDLRFERDGDSAFLEEWLRERDFIINVHANKRTAR